MNKDPSRAEAHLLGPAAERKLNSTRKPGKIALTFCFQRLSRSLALPRFCLADELVPVRLHVTRLACFFT